MAKSPTQPHQRNTSSTSSHGQRLRGSETILLVEDEQCLRTLASVFLGRQGYRVLEASLPNEAIAISEKHDGDIQLLLTDVTLPGMDGRALAQHILKQRPKTKVLYVSGYPKEILQQLNSPTPEISFMEKPFTLEALGEKIRELLDSAGGSTDAEMRAAG
jgi:two-component system cell cycle sensor histidine kinase/response regulator CckA